jgi:hypothetical protein
LQASLSSGNDGTNKTIEGGGSTSNNSTIIHIKSLKHQIMSVACAKAVVTDCQLKIKGKEKSIQDKQQIVRGLKNQLKEAKASIIDFKREKEMFGR